METTNLGQAQRAPGTLALWHFGSSTEAGAAFSKGREATQKTSCRHLDQTSPSTKEKDETKREDTETVRCEFLSARLGLMEEDSNRAETKQSSELNSMNPLSIKRKH